MANRAPYAPLLSAVGRLPPRTRRLLLGVVLALVFWLGLIGFVLPRREARLQLEEEVRTLLPVTTELRQQVAALGSAAQGEEALRQAIAQTRARLDATLARVPERRDVASFLRNLTAPEAQDGVAFLAIAPLAPERRGELEELPFTLELEGTYPSITRYLARLETLSRLVTIRRVSLAGAAGSPGVLRASVVAATYVLGKSP